MNQYSQGEWKAIGSFITAPIDGNEVEVCRMTQYRNEAETKANQILMVAAPDMYQALKRLVKMMPDCGGCIKTETAIIEAQEAIQKAEGRAE